ncbi:uncharacterized protein TrAFT101_007408 [Trichoderma asperellum]|nr:hypothetical protein TrAFT101_007408 [Trichoderma asperellum]
MSEGEQRIRKAQVRFKVLQSVHSYFSDCLPTRDDINNGRYCLTSRYGLSDVDDITILRADINLLPITLQHISNGQAISKDIDQLINALDPLLSLFEQSVQFEEKSYGSIPELQVIEPFPKLAFLQSLGGQSGILRKDICDTDNAKTGISLQSAATGNTFVLEIQRSVFGLDIPSPYIKFPPPGKTIADCQGVIERFKQAVYDISRDEATEWDAESQLQKVTKEEESFIKDTHDFNTASSSLFKLLVERIGCNAEHTARLHLSGFRTTQLEMFLKTCHKDEVWIPASFIHSLEANLSETKFEPKMCAYEPRCRMIRGCFNGTKIWEDYTVGSETHDLPIASLPSMMSDHLSKEHISQSINNQSLGQINRKIVGLLLACSLLKLCGSPWIQHTFEAENIYLSPHSSPNNSLNSWRAHIPCKLGSHPSTRLLPEDVAAIGVLILELEANCTAGWTEYDKDYYTEVNSNRLRLSRILKEWKNSHFTDFYHGIGMSCLYFEALVANFHHPGIREDLKHFAVLYKCIINPLYQKLVSEFGAAARLFEGAPGLSLLSRQQNTSTLSPIVLYDDWESFEPDEKSKHAQKLTLELEDGFLCKIKTLRENLESISLARAYTGIKTPEPIRIAILDTGIDTTDKMIGPASRSRIKAKRSWVGSIEDYEDRYGHGTHVTRLLLKMAPAADIYIAKITDGKTVDAKDMDRIAEAIDWAMKEWKVHIISMSFGYESKKQAIEDAIERASKAGILMFAAASNEGGNRRDRSRPGRNPEVICIHACDGKGNRGDMNPNPQRNEYNFTALGVAVKSYWKKKKVYKSGTSFATPVAAAFAADILEFANFRCELKEEDKKLLYKKHGMQAVFRSMSNERDEYDYLQPNLLWDDGDDDDKVAAKIGKILASL